MKRWTVMVIPEGQGTTRSLHLYAFQLWAVVFVVAALGFTSSFFFQRCRVTRRAMAAQQEAARAAQDDVKVALPGAPEQETRLAAEVRAEIERQIREEYEARELAITAELGALYDEEAKLRERHKLPPRTQSFAVQIAESSSREGGKGGPPDSLGDEVEVEDDDMMRPPQLIYGLSQPSADLIVQEINLRTESLRDLRLAMDDRKDRIDRMPSISPCSHRRAKITSRFGSRVDPFTRRIRHHEGVDISAPRGCSVVATAKGEVTFAGWENYYGYLVKINHGDGISTWYAHLDKIAVKKGHVVERGDEIGKLGNTGRSTGPHVHYEVRVNGKPLNGEKYFR
jgi:murein DD-endopeptidase MepM/ murein hydrolase activator NlpD